MKEGERENGFLSITSHSRMLRPTTRLLNPLRTRRARPPLPIEALPRRIGPQAAFAVGGSLLFIGGAAWATNRDTENREKGSWSPFGRRQSTGLQSSHARSRFEEVYARAKGFVNQFPGNRLVVILNEKYLEMGEAKRTSAGLIASFLVVTLVWKLPQSARFGKWLAHDPLSGRSITQLTSVFSHRVSFRFSRSLLRFETVSDGSLLLPLLR